jgi:hypothetical protein
LRLFDCEKGSSAADFVTDLTDEDLAADFVADLTDVTDEDLAADLVTDLTDVTDVTD